MAVTEKKRQHKAENDRFVRALRKELLMALLEAEGLLAIASQARLARGSLRRRAPKR